MVKQLLQNTQRVLQPVQIRNPYAEQLQLPANVFKPRRTNAHYLAFIEAITFYHQCQRAERVDDDTGELYIETTLEDIAAANELMKDILLRKSDELTEACRNYFERLKAYLQAANIRTFTLMQISKSMRVSISTVKRHNLALLSSGHLIKQNTQKPYKYEVTSFEDYQQLQSSITTALDSILARLNSPIMAQSTTEPTKPVKDKEQLQSDFTWGKGAEIQIVEEPGGNNAAKGYTDAKGNIQLDIRLVRLLESANTEEKEAALLAVIATLLHEQTHRGDILAGRVSASSVPGSDLVNDLYSLQVSEAKFPDTDFAGAAIYHKDFEKEILAGAKRIIENNRERKEERDLPTLKADSLFGWLNYILSVNPNIKVTIL